MLNYRIVLGVIATLVGLSSYIPYFRDIFRKRTKPHIFSWLAWGVLGGVAFAAQVVKGAGPGAWVTAITTIACLAIAALAFTHGEKNITKTDWACFIAALLGIALWFVLKDPLGAVIVVTIANTLAFIPTYRKSYSKPSQETLSSYGLSALKWAIGVSALQAFTLTTLLYPVVLTFTNGSFALIFFLRRRSIGDSQNS